MPAKLRGIVILMAMLVCFSLLFSCFFMAHESGHICCRERCAISIIDPLPRQEGEEGGKQ